MMRNRDQSASATQFTVTVFERRVLFAIALLALIGALFLQFWISARASTDFESNVGPVAARSNADLAIARSAAQSQAPRPKSYADRGYAQADPLTAMTPRPLPPVPSRLSAYAIPAMTVGTSGSSPRLAATPVPRPTMSLEQRLYRSSMVVPLTGGGQQ